MYARKRSVRLTATALTVLVGAALSLGTHHAHATDAATAGAATELAGGSEFALPPGAPAPGPGFEIESVYFVLKGVQTYTCTDAGTFATASTPTAILKKYRGWRFITHYAGPRWTARDGSTLLGAVVERVDQEGTIPWLLLTVTHEVSPPRGELNDVTHISRVNTTGGLRPTDACTPGETRAVPYTADYVFWVPAES